MYPKCIFRGLSQKVELRVFYPPRCLSHFAMGSNDTKGMMGCTQERCRATLDDVNARYDDHGRGSQDGRIQNYN